MEHPVLDRVRQCSAHPERAAAFFGKLLWPWERSRSNAGDALQEFYLQDTRQEMRRDRQQAGKESGEGTTVLQNAAANLMSLQNEPYCCIYEVLRLVSICTLAAEAEMKPV